MFFAIGMPSPCGRVPHFMGEGVEVHVNMSYLSSGALFQIYAQPSALEECLCACDRPLHISFTSYQGMLFGQLKIDTEPVGGCALYLEFSFDAHGVDEGAWSELESLLKPGTYAGASIVVIDASTNVIKGLRFGTINSVSTRFLIGNILDQKRMGLFAPQQSAAIADAYYARYPDALVASRAMAVRGKFGGNDHV